jgi:hypothetical protein
LDAWDTFGNGWLIEDGELLMTQGGEQRALTGEESWTDYVVKLGLAELSQGNGYGLYFRTTGEPDSLTGYVFQYDPGYRTKSSPNGSFLIRKVENGQETPPIARADVPADFEWHDNAHDVAVDVSGETFDVSINGESVLTANDDSYANGRVGLRTWDGSRATFDNLTVTNESAPAPAPSSSSDTSSSSETSTDGE